MAPKVSHLARIIYGSYVHRRTSHKQHPRLKTEFSSGPESESKAELDFKIESGDNIERLDVHASGDTGKS
ncbi:hypothetical protein EVAR_47800_1 [Eumeta japonica]|uniref:Uncharacterized protein n=1 Tax=Eumeta variegata TaxID=151549 RepID=A0A4C1ZB61_EUMVA|nr:hypothetical protein EVAR_47800_1 [Eumeta japonica]